MLQSSCFSKNKNSISIKPVAVKGFLNLSAWDFDKNGSAVLAGEWEFYWNKLYFSSDFNSDNDLATDYIQVPHSWNGKKVSDKKIDSDGYATYRLIVKLSKPGNFAIRSDNQYTSYRIFIDGCEVSSKGVISTTKDSAIPVDSSTLVFNRTGNRDVEIIVHVSNYSHRNGGLVNNLMIGSHTGLSDYVNKIRNTDIFLSGILLIMGCYYFGLFFPRRRDKSTLIFALFCFIVFLRTLTSREDILTEIYPLLSYGFTLRLEYTTFYLIMPLSVHFLYLMFKKDIPVILVKILYFISGMFLMTLFLPVKLTTYFIPYYQYIIFPGLSIGSYYIIITVIRKREYSVLILTGYLSILLTSVNDIFNSMEIIKTSFYIQYGFIILIFSQSLALSRKFSNAFNKVEILSDELIKTNNAYYKFVPNEFLKYLDKKKITDINLGDSINAEMTVLFADIRSFTALSEKMLPEDNFKFLNSYLKRVSPIITSYNGFIDKYVGDEIMALFPSVSNNALDAGIELQRTLLEYNRHRYNSGYDPIAVGVGINCGQLILGTIGEQNRMQTTVISDAVNLASRLEGLTKRYGAKLIISGGYFEKIINREQYNYRILDNVLVKGKNDPVLVYEILLDFYDKEFELKMKTKALYEEAVSLYFSDRKSEALALFNKVLQEDPSDKAPDYFITKCFNF